MSYYEPELGQAAFGQPYKTYTVPQYVEAAFMMIDNELDRVMWNTTQEEWPSPFQNTGNGYKNDTFEVEAYSWDEEYEQPYNFKWKDLEVSWYKHMRRGASMNRETSPAEIAEMLVECLESLSAYEKEKCPDLYEGE